MRGIGSMRIVEVLAYTGLANEMSGLRVAPVARGEKPGDRLPEPMWVLTRKELAAMAGLPNLVSEAGQDLANPVAYDHRGKPVYGQKSPNVDYLIR